MLHDTSDRPLLLWLVVVGCVMKRRILTRVEGWVVVKRRGELEHRGRNLLFLSFTSSKVRLLTRGRGVNTRKADCEWLQRSPWWVNSGGGVGCRAGLLLLLRIELLEHMWRFRKVRVKAARWIRGRLVLLSTHRLLPLRLKGWQSSFKPWTGDTFHLCIVS